MGLSDLSDFGLGEGPKRPVRIRTCSIAEHTARYGESWSVDMQAATLCLCVLEPGSFCP